MKRVFKWLAWISVVFVILNMPIRTEYRVQKVKWHLKNDSSIGGLVLAFGDPSRVIKPGDHKTAFNGEIVELTENEELWVYHEEGIPYWRFGVVTDDGATIRRYYVARGRIW